MNIGIEFATVYQDQDVLKVRISAWNGTFAGATEVYEGRGNLTAAADKLRGFPRRLGNRIDLNFGSNAPDDAGGSVSLHFYTAGGQGRVFVRISFTTEPIHDGFAESAMMLLPIDPAAIDSYLSQLVELDAQRAKRAFLAGRSDAGEPH